jgi:Fe-S cluster assembly protein SufD
MSTLRVATESSFEIPAARADENYRYVSLRDIEWKNLDAASALGKPKTGTAVLLPAALKGDYFAEIAAIRSSRILEIELSGQEDFRLSPELIHSAALQVEHIRIRVKAGANVDLLEDLLSEAGTHQLHLIEVFVEAGAKLRYFFLQDFSLKSAFALRHFFELASDTHVDFCLYHHGGAKGQHRVETVVKGKGSSFKLKAAVRARETQAIDLWVNTTHPTSDSTSETSVWNVVEDSATVVFNGNIKITPEGMRTQAYQSNKNLLLSAKAQVHTLPKLEIATDDVKCSHGASVASLDSNQIFYLESRGINKDAAEKMLIDAYTFPVLSCLRDEELKEKYHATEEELL